MLCGVPSCKRQSHNVTTSAFFGLHKVKNNTRVSLFCDFSYIDFSGKPVTCKHLKMARKEERTTMENKDCDFVWSLDGKSLSNMLILAEGSIILYLFAMFNTLENTVKKLRVHLMYAWTECRHDIALQLLCVYLDVKHLWPLFTAPSYLVFQTCNSIYMHLNHKVLLTTVHFLLPSFSFATKCHCWTVFAKPW